MYDYEYIIAYMDKNHINSHQSGQPLVQVGQYSIAPVIWTERKVVLNYRMFIIALLN